MNSYINSISLNIAFDVKWMNASNQVGGGFQYAERLISSLAQYTQNNIFALMTEGSEDALAHLVKFRNFHIRIVGATLWSFWQAIRKEQIDVIHAPIQHYSHYLKSIPMIATLHDLQHVHFPGFFSDEAISQREHGYRKVALASQKVIVSYPHVKQDVSNYYGIPSGKIEVCEIGFDLPTNLNPPNFATLKKKYGIPESYLIYTANTYIHKNHVRLVKALKILREKYHQEISLVCLGWKVPEYYQVIQKEVADQRLEKHVLFLGYVSEEEKASLLQAASLAVIPTLYEAGSFPLMEAMHYGVPVICSNVTSLPETIGDERFVFDPYDIEGIANKMNLMLTDEQYRLLNCVNSKNQVARHKWERTVWQFDECYKGTCREFAKRGRAKVFGDMILDMCTALYAEMKRQTRKRFSPMVLARTLVPTRLKNLLKRYRTER